MKQIYDKIIMLFTLPSYILYIVLKDPDIISHLINKDSTRREMLLGHLEQVAAFVNDLPQARKNELITAFPQMDNEMARARDQLRNEHCVILVAGRIYSIYIILI